jgi:tetratricopeptide (TPR) repeat protein
VILRRARAAAAALAAVVLLPWPAHGDGLADAEREAARAEERLEALAALAARPEEAPALRAARKLAEGETQYLLGDWRHAAILLADAVEEPAFRDHAERPRALFLLAEALRRGDACGAARAAYAELLALGARERRGDAIAGALACAVKERRHDDVVTLLEEADRAFAGDPPADVRYLAARALFARTDLAAADRLERGLALFEAVPAPYRHQAAYHEGVLLVEKGDLAGALARFEACAALSAGDDRQRDVREVCLLAAGRVHGELGHPAEAIDWYGRIPRESPRFEEALYEIAWTHVRAARHGEALRTAGLLVELAPGSPLAPEATILQGHLLLELGRYAEATDAYSRVINGYAPVRDELDAILALDEDPVRYLNELIGQRGDAFDVASVLPAVAVRWASNGPDVAGALELVTALDAGRRDVDDADATAGRLDAVLARENGLDAFPPLRQAFAAAEALGNAAAALEGAAADAAFDGAAAALDPETRRDLDALRARRRGLEARVAALPRSPEDARARLERMRSAIDAAEREAFRLAAELESTRAAITGAERWLEAHRAEIAADAESRAEFTDELREHHAVLGLYSEELRAVRGEIAVARDGAAGAEALADEARLRAGYLDLLARERALLDAARGRLGAGGLVVLDRAGALSDRLRAVRGRAHALGAAVAAEAARRAGELRVRVADERRAVAEHARALDAVQADAKDLVGRIAHRAFVRARGDFYRLVLKADVGLVDVAWARKRVRLEKIQGLSMQKADELRQLDADHRDLLREAD